MWNVTSTPHKRLKGDVLIFLPAFEEGTDWQIKVIIFNESRKRILHTHPRERIYAFTHRNSFFV